MTISQLVFYRRKQSLFIKKLVLFCHQSSRHSEFQRKARHRETAEPGFTHCVYC